MTYKLAIFDFDGTIANSYPWMITVMEQFADKFDLKKIEKDQIGEYQGYDPSEMIKVMRIPFWKIPLMMNYSRTMMANDIHQIPLFEGVEQLFRNLAQKGVLIGIVSSNSVDNVRQVLGTKNAELVKYFECGASMFGKPAKFKKILRKSGIRPDEAICIGDEIRDIRAANKVNIPFGAVSWGYTNVDAIKAYAPREIFINIDDLYNKVCA